MPLVIKPRVQIPAQDFEFSASPYIGDKLWLDGLEMLHQWMAGYFEVGDAFADYCLAEALGVHRCISDLWLACMRGQGMVELHEFYKGNKEIYAPGFILIPVAKPININLKVSNELKNFDPWVDRTLDAEVPDAVYADYIVDKYFDVFLNEFFFYTGHMRKRPNGKTFQPLDLTEHPRHANVKTPSDKAPDPEWRELIDDLSCL